MKSGAYRAPNGVIVTTCPSAPTWGKHATDPLTGHTRCTAYREECADLPPPVVPRASQTHSEYLREAEALKASRSTTSGLRVGVQRELDRLRDRAEAEALLDAEQGGDDGPVLSSLTEAIPVPDPTILELPDGSFLFRKGWIHWVHGKGGSGKTPLAYMTAVGVIRSGERVLVIDHEMGMDGALDLLRDLAPDLTDEQIETQVRYVYEKPLHNGRIREKLLSELDGFTPSLVIVDAVTGSMAEGSQNDNADVNRWFRAVPQWFRDQFGAAVIVIDHSNREDGPMPSGSARKHGAPEFRLWVRLVRDFNPDHEDGCSLLEVRKERGRHARTGKVVAELRTVLRGSFTLRAADSVSATGGDLVDVDLGAMPASLAAEQTALEILQRLATWVLTHKVTGGSGADSQRLRKALDRLESKGLVASRPDGKTARGLLWCASEFLSGVQDE